MARRDRERSGKKNRQSIRDKARQAAETRERSGGGLDTLQNLPQDIEFFKPKKGRGEKGKNHFSIIPYVVSIENHPFQTPHELWHECTYWQHVVGAGDDRKRFVCLKKTEQSENKKCPICEYREKLIKNGDDKELAESLKPKQRQIFNLLDHDDEDKGIQLFEMSPHQFGFMLDDEDRVQSADFDDRFYGDFENGLSIKARFSEGSFQGHKFPEIARIDFEERDDLDASILEEAVDLDAALRILTPEEMEKKFFELEDGMEDEPEDEEEKSSRNTKTTTRKSSKRDEPDHDHDHDPEDEPEEKKKTTSKKTSTRKQKEDDNECPSGFIFGKDNDTEDECDSCDKWDDCRDEKDRLEAESKKSKKNRRTTGEDIPF